MKVGAELHATDSYGNTALNIAANNHHVDCMKELLKAGAELNGTHKAGNTALIDAAGNGHVDCVKELVKAGAELNTGNNDGNTALIVCHLQWSCKLCEGASESLGLI